MNVRIVVMALLMGTLLACNKGGDNTLPFLVSIAVTPANQNITLGKTQQFSATGTYSDSSTKDLTPSATWGSSNTAIATINSAGLASMVSAGTVMITATSGSVSGSSTLTVTPNSPFGIYSPYGEFQRDGGTFATTEDISGYLQDIGVPWVQELPLYAGFDSIPAAFNIYSRVGKEAGINSSNITNPIIVANYKTAVAQRVGKYKDRVKYWEVDTEPDGVGGWRNNPQGYAELLKITYAAIKGECAECKVMFGGLAGGQAALDIGSAAFLESVLQAGAAGYFDGMEFKRHHTASKDYTQIKVKYDSIGTILSKYGIDIQQMPVFVETAMYDGDPNDPVPNLLESGLPVQTEKEQAQGLIKTYVYGASIGVDRIFWVDVYERSDYEPGHAAPFPQNPFNHYGLINNPTNNDGLAHKKLAYYTYKKMVEMLGGSDWNNIQTTLLPGNVYIFKFTRNTSPVYAAWWDYFNDSTYTPGKTMTVSLAGLAGSSAVVTEAVPKFSTGAEVTDYSSAFNKSTVAVSGGSATLTLGDSPVLVEVTQ